MEGCLENDNEPSCSIKGEEFLAQLSVLVGYQERLCFMDLVVIFLLSLQTTNLRLPRLAFSGCLGSNFLVSEPAGSSPYSQEPATGPYPEPTGSNPHPSSQSLVFLKLSLNGSDLSVSLWRDIITRERIPDKRLGTERRVLLRNRKVPGSNLDPDARYSD
jgi:hypothetical protein